MGYPWGAEGVFNDKNSFFFGSLHITTDKFPWKFQHVGLSFLVKKHCTFFHSLYWVEYPRQHLIFYLDERQGLFSYLRACGCNSSNLITNGEDLSCLEGRVILHNAYSEGRRHVGCSDNGPDSGELFCP